MSDDHHRFKLRKLLFYFVEFLPEDRRGVGKGITTRVTVEPELVIFSDYRIRAQFVKHWRPSRLRIAKSVDHENDGLVRIERLEPLDCRGVRVLLRIENA